MVKRSTSAGNDLVGTVRRGITDRGFWHLIKLDQAKGTPCWEAYDAYGSTTFLGEKLLTDDEVDEQDRTEVVYVPMEDTAWATMHGLVHGTRGTEAEAEAEEK